MITPDLADDRDGLQTRKPWQVHIHQSQVHLVGPHEIDRFFATLGHQSVEALGRRRSRAGFRERRDRRR